MAEMNAFLSSRKVLEIEKELVNERKHAYWCFCVTYVEGEMPQASKEKPDYQKVLGEAAYARFSRMREIRKRLAQEESVPAYAVFTDEELASIAKLEEVTVAAMRSIQGVGEKKVEKYGQHFVTAKKDEKGE